MPPRAKRKATDDDYLSSTGYYSYGVSQHPPFSAPSMMTTPTSAFLRALDEPKAKEKKKAKIADTGEVTDAGKSKPKKTRKDSDFEAPPAPEKRGAIFKKRCPKNIIERAERVISQRCAFEPFNQV